MCCIRLVIIVELYIVLILFTFISFHFMEDLALLNLAVLIISFIISIIKIWQQVGIFGIAETRP